MRRKGIILSLVGIFLVICSLVVLANNKKEKYIMQDGTMLALTLNGDTIVGYPEKGEYVVKVSCKNGTGIWLPEEWKLVVENVTGNVMCNLDFYTRTDADKLTNVVIANANTNKNGNRYSGANPNNYIWFNNEMWRIIGNIPVCTSSGCGSSENMVKIIRETSIGDFQFSSNSDDANRGIWGTNTLYTLLNTYYYGKQNGNDYAGCSAGNCEYTNSGLSSSDYYGAMVKNVYWNSGKSSNNKTAASAYTNETTNQTVQGHVGLMGLSDYGYASNYHSRTFYNFNSASVTSTNWLFANGEKEWTIVQTDTNINWQVMYINSYAVYGTDATSYMGVRPVVYLDPNVYVICGDGTENNPYQISM